MNHRMPLEKGYSIYPGEYVPLYETTMMMEALRHQPRKNMESQPLKLLECDDCFKVDLALPGVRREELMVCVRENTLSVAVLPAHGPEPVDRQVFLPEYIAPEFVTASFNLGILHVYLPKSTSPSGLQFHNVAVY